MEEGNHLFIRPTIDMISFITCSMDKELILGEYNPSHRLPLDVLLDENNSSNYLKSSSNAKKGAITSSTDRFQIANSTSSSNLLASSWLLTKSLLFVIDKDEVIYHQLSQLHK